MESLTTAYVAAVIFFATSFRTVFGFGEALIAVPLLALVIPVKVATPVVVMASIVVAGFVVVRDRQYIHLGSAGWLLFSTLPGIPMGLWLLKTVHESAVKLVLACILILFSSWSLLRPRSRPLRHDRFAWIFGLVAGVLGGAYGMNGLPLAIYGSLRGWTPQRFRATLQGYFLPASILGICGFALSGLLTTPVEHLFLIVLPSIVAGIVAGRLMTRHIHQQRFSRLLYAALIFIALILTFQSLR